MYCLIDGWSGVIMTGESPMQFATEVEAESWAKALRASDVHRPPRRSGSQAS